MEDSQSDVRSPADHRGPAGADDPVLEAQRLFGRLIQEGPPAGPSPRSGLKPAGEPPAPALPPQVAGGHDPADVPLDVVRAALAATDRLAEVVDLISVQSDANTADLAALGSAIETALTATNERLAGLERSLLGEAAPASEPAAEAMTQLRRTLRRIRRRAGSRSADRDPQSGLH